MVEPVVAALNPFSNYFYPNVVLQLLNVTARHLSMESSPLSASGTEPTVFYRTRAKGKERAVPEGDPGMNMHWLHDSRCRSPSQLPPNNTSSSYLWRITPASTLPGLSAFSPAATRGFPSNFVPCHIRHSSHAAEAGAPLQYEPPDVSESLPDDPTLLVTTFIAGHRLRSTGKYVSKAVAWNALEYLRSRSSSPSVDIYAFLEQLARSLLQHEVRNPNPSHLSRLPFWTKRAFELLSVVRPAGDTSVPTEQWLSLKARFHAMRGEMEEAIVTCDRLVQRRADAFAASMHAQHRTELLTEHRSPPPSSAEVVMLYTLLEMLYRTGSVRAVLSFVLPRWDTVGVHVVDPTVQLPHIGKTGGEPLHRALFPMADELVVSSATSLVTGTRQDRIHTAHLLVYLFMMRGAPDDALVVLDSVDEQGLKLPERLRLPLSHALVKARASESAMHVFSGIDPNTLDWHDDALVDQYLSTGLTLYSSRGDAAKSQEFFESLQDRGRVSDRKVSQLLHAYAETGDKEGTVEVFQRFFSAEGEARTPDVVHYFHVLLAHMRARDPSGVQHWLRELLQAGFKPDVHVYSSLVKFYAERGDAPMVSSLVKQTLERKLRPSPEVFTTVISMLGKQRNSSAAQDVYRRALDAGVVPDKTMISALMNAHAESGSWMGAIRAFEYLLAQGSRGRRPGAHEFNTLLKSYVLLGAPFWAVRALLEKMERYAVRPTQHTYSLAIQSASDHGHMDTATGLYRRFERLVADSGSGFEMNVYVLTILMSGWLRMGNTDRAREIYEDMLARGIKPSAVTYGAIIKQYAIEGTEESLASARAFLGDILSAENSADLEDADTPRDVALQTMVGPLMYHAAGNRDQDTVEALQAQVVAEGGDRTLGLLTITMHAHRRSGDVAAARKIWEEVYARALHLSDVGNLTARDGALKRPSHLISLPLSIILDVLSTAGAHTEVAKLWGEVHSAGFAFDARNWNHLVVVLVRAGEIARAFAILERVILPNRVKAQEPVPTHIPRDSPLLTAEEFEEASALGGGGLSANVRVGNAKRTDRFTDPSDFEGVDDGGHGSFLHPLRLLQHVAPAWNQWRPHIEVVRLLWAVLEHLQDGNVVKPVALRGGVQDLGKDQGDEEVEEKVEFGEEAIAAQEMLEALERENPATLEYLLEWRRVTEGRDAEWEARYIPPSVDL
ncbi:hypothetical protein PENSPDRAFT_632500 [Peniophora sp. CONT]|nr:hypothetical protein PENSPDRAFT_632500 [Peniophora sp. CONT]